MTLKERLTRRLDLLSDFGILVDEANDLVVFYYNRKLDCPITMLKHLTKPRFTELLDQAQEAYLRYHKI